MLDLNLRKHNMSRNRAGVPVAQTQDTVMMQQQRARTNIKEKPAAPLTKQYSNRIKNKRQFGQDIVKNE
jgi:hypothetical protein